MSSSRSFTDGAEPTTTPTDGLAALLRNPQRLEAIPARQLPAVLAQLGTLQMAVAVRLLDADDAAEPSEDVITVVTAASRLGVSPDWIYRRTKSLPFIVRLGRNVRCSVRELDRFIKNRIGR